MTTRIKICGVTRPDDGARAAAAGADFVGLNFWAKSKRYLAIDRAPMVAAAVRGAGAARIVGVFVDASADEVANVIRQVDLDVIQLHGAETVEDVVAIASAANRPVWKAIAAGSPADVVGLDRWPVEAIMLDAPTPGRGGSGATFDWTLARDARRRYPATKVVLAGGLSADNVAAAIATVDPWAVDVASGVEAAPGIKDAAKLVAFVGAVRGSGG